MVNQIFAIAHEGVRHPSAGLVAGTGAREALQTGLSVGYRGAFSTDGDVGRNAFFQQMLLFPVSDFSAGRFLDLVEIMGYLIGQNRLPYYLSEDLSVNEYVDPREDRPLELDGTQSENIPGSSFYYEPNHRDMRGATVVSWVYSTFPQIRRVRANCTTFVSFVAQMSGIDLDDIYPRWSEIKRGARLARVFRGVAARAQIVADIGDAYTVKRTETYSGAPMVIVECNREFSTPASPGTIRGGVQAACEAAGGFENLQTEFAGAKPLECEPLPVPGYLKDQIAACGLEMS